ncbi:MAG: ABC transporter permease [Thermoleophilia bacterium]|nr:ABC transporter permease [Thermoleophilia bacterium]
MSTTVPTVPLEVTPAVRTDSVVRRLLRRPTGAVSVVVVGLLVLGALGAPLFAPYAPTTLDYTHLFAPPTRDHLFGTDELGRDLLTRVLYGGRTSILLGFAATGVAMGLGIVWGFAAALREGWLGEILMRAADTLMAMPAILLGLVLVAAFGTSTLSMVMILGIIFAPATARIARSTLLAELRSEYYLAAVSVGASGRRIVARELLPNALPVLVSRASLVLAEVIFVEASLSFIGLGIQPPETSWVTLLQQGYANLYSSYTYAVFPGLVILVAVLALNTLADNLQKVLDPARA